MTVALKGNWNYPTTVWAGPGRLAELPDACRRAGMAKPLIVTDQGLVAAPMIRTAAELLRGAPVFGSVQGNPNAAHV